METISLNLGNYYGGVCACKHKKEYWLEIDDHSGTDKVKISKKLYKAIKKEFKNPNSTS